MPNSTINLAELTIGIAVLCESTIQLCCDYVVPIREVKPDFVINVLKEDIVAEKMKAEINCKFEGKRVRTFSKEELEQSALLRKIGEKLPLYNGLVFHGSAVSVDGEGYIFSAPSGTGKSTHANLWRSLLNGRFMYVNDDKPIIRFIGNDPYIYGSPWDGKHHRSNNIKVPLRGIAFLNRGSDNSIKVIGATSAFSVLLQQTYRPESKESFLRTLTMLDKLIGLVKLYHMECNMDISAAQMAYKKMSENT